MISTPACTRDITQIDSRGRARSCVCARMCVCMIKGTKGTKGRREDPSRKRAQGRWPRPGTVPSDQPRASPSCLSILPATSYHARDAPTDGSSALGNPVDSLTHPCQLNTAQRYNRTEENHPLFVSEHLRLSLSSILIAPFRRSRQWDGHCDQLHRSYCASRRIQPVNRASYIYVHKTYILLAHTYFTISEYFFFWQKRN